MTGLGTPIIIDADKVVGTFLWDSSAFVRAFDPSSPEPDAPLARAVSDAMLRRRDTRLVVSTVSFAEFLLLPGRVFPRHRQIVVVPFDELAARECAEKVPQTVPQGDPRPADYWKRDALITATALALKVDGFVSADISQRKRAAEVGLKVMCLTDFVAEPEAQMDFFPVVARGPLR